jgi:hypothetical protein
LSRATRLAVRDRRRPKLLRDRAPQRGRPEHLGLRAELQDPSPQLASIIELPRSSPNEIAFFSVIVRCPKPSAL